MPKRVNVVGSGTELGSGLEVELGSGLEVVVAATSATRYRYDVV
jgi:hypothetical protein